MPKETTSLAKLSLIALALVLGGPLVLFVALAMLASAQARSRG